MFIYFFFGVSPFCINFAAIRPCHAMGKQVYIALICTVFTAYEYNCKSNK